MPIRSFWNVLFLVCSGLAQAQGPSNVLLVINSNSAESRAVGEYYREKRAIPTANICTLSAPATEQIDRAGYERAIQRPIADCLGKGGLQDQVLYIVLTKGVPLVVQVTAQQAAQNAARKPSDKSPGNKNEDGSVDSALAPLYSSMLGLPLSPELKSTNPYFLRNARGGQQTRFSHREFPMYLVTRLDGYDVADVKALIDRGIQAAASNNAANLKAGRFYFDQRADNETPGNKWLADAAEGLRAAGIPASRIVVEPTGQFLTGSQQVLGYANWGSNDPADHTRYLKNQWLPGALMAEFVSSNGRTFARPPATWNIGGWKDAANTFFHGSPQTLIGDYIHEGVTGVAGNVAEPLLEACVRPQVLFPAYVQGLNLAESFYAAMPYLNWKGVVIGDPLVSPFAKTPLPAEDAKPAMHNGLGLPVFFARHLVRARSRLFGEKLEVTELILIADRLRQRRDIVGARQAAQRALQLSPDSIRGLQLMAELSPIDQAIPLFERVVELSPQNGSALNNLAYLLATVQNKPKEALPFAARAADLAQGRNPAVLDTYGWILYLVGQYQDACPYLEKAAAQAPPNAALLFHAGMCHRKVGRVAEGNAQLERALSLSKDPALTAAIRKAM